jgi:hypothetical protein
MAQPRIPLTGKSFFPTRGPRVRARHVVREDGDTVVYRVAGARAACTRERFFQWRRLTRAVTVTPSAA